MWHFLSISYKLIATFSNETYEDSSKSYPLMLPYPQILQYSKIMHQITHSSEKDT